MSMEEASVRLCFWEQDRRDEVDETRRRNERGGPQSERRNETKKGVMKERTRM